MAAATFTFFCTIFIAVVFGIGTVLQNTLPYAEEKQATAYKDGTVWVIGGQEKRDSSVYKWDFTSSSFTFISRTNLPNDPLVGGGQWWAQKGDIVYMVSHDPLHPLYTFNVVTNAITSDWMGVTLPSTIRDYTGKCLAASDEHLFILGTRDMYGNLNDVYVLSLSTYSWLENTPPSTYPRYGGACVHYKEELWIFGGYDYPPGTLTSSECINTTDITQKSWRDIASLPYGLSWARAVAYNDNIFVVGGDRGGGSYSNGVVIYDTNTYAVTTAANGLALAVSNFAMVLVDRFIYIFGGHGIGGHIATDTIQMYDTNPPTEAPTSPSEIPTIAPSKNPTALPSITPTNNPTAIPSINPTTLPSISPSKDPTTVPSIDPTTSPSKYPTLSPTLPSQNPTESPTKGPTLSPTKPSVTPTSNPSSNPSSDPSVNPSNAPSNHPSSDPSSNPSLNPSVNPSVHPSTSPSTNPVIVFVSTSVNDSKVSASDKTAPLVSDVVIVGSSTIVFIVVLCALYQFRKKRKASDVMDMMATDIDVAKQESVPGPGVDISKWTVDEVYSYFSFVNDGGLIALAKLFKEEGVRGRALVKITDDDLLRMGVSLGNRMEFRTIRDELVKQFDKGDNQKVKKEHAVEIVDPQVDVQDGEGNEPKEGDVVAPDSTNAIMEVPVVHVDDA
eukprot:126208_1